MLKDIPENVRAVAAVLDANAYQAFLVGGAVRDFMFGNVPKDFDVATDARPEEMKHVFDRVEDMTVHSVGNGERHGTVVVTLAGHPGSVEVTTFRRDVNCDGRHAEVEFSRFLRDDLSRRDFTINAMAMNLDELDVYGKERLVDLNHAGVQDVGLDLVRCVGNPDERFHEDWLRMLRACRFCALNERMRMSEVTFLAVQRNAQKVLNVAPERIMLEMLKLMSYPNPSRGLVAMQQTGLLEFVLPEVNALVGMEQNRWHELYMCTECGEKFQKIVDPEFVGFHRIGD